jgi:hypothetical protein
VDQALRNIWSAMVSGPTLRNLILFPQYG